MSKQSTLTQARDFVLHDLRETRSIIVKLYGDLTPPDEMQVAFLKRAVERLKKSLRNFESLLPEAKASKPRRRGEQSPPGGGTE